MLLRRQRIRSWVETEHPCTVAWPARRPSPPYCPRCCSANHAERRSPRPSESSGVPADSIDSPATARHRASAVSRVLPHNPEHVRGADVGVEVPDRLAHPDIVSLAVQVDRLSARSWPVPSGEMYLDGTSRRWHPEFALALQRLRIGQLGRDSPPGGARRPCRLTPSVQHLPEAGRYGSADDLATELAAREPRIPAGHPPPTTATGGTTPPGRRRRTTPRPADRGSGGRSRRDAGRSFAGDRPAGFG